MKLSKNLLFGLTNSIWSALIAIAVVPIYIRYLGAESYGLIGFFATTQALVTLLDLGLSATVNREIARNNLIQNQKENTELLQTLAFIYWLTAALIGAIIFLLAKWISKSWLQVKGIPLETVSSAIMLIGFVIACRWPIALYQGAIIGSERLVLHSTINIIMVSLSNLGAVFVLATLSPTIGAFFLWQAIIGALYLVIVRFFAWKIVPKPTSFKFNLNRLKHVWRFSAGMSGIAVAGLALTQLDKLILSKLLPLETFGQYMLATMLASGLYLLVTPFYNVIYPRFSTLVAADNSTSLLTLYTEGSRLLATVVFAVASILIVYSYDILYLWTNNKMLATDIAPVLSILAIGTAFHCVMYFPYALTLAYGKTNLALKIGTVLVLLLLPLTIVLTIKLGVIGGALSWLILHIIYLFFGTYMTHKELLRGIGVRWLTQDIGVPLFICSALAALEFIYIRQNLHYSSLQKLGIGLLLAVPSSILSVSTSINLRTYLVKCLQQIKINIQQILMKITND